MEFAEERGLNVRAFFPPEIVMHLLGKGEGTHKKCRLCDFLSVRILLRPRGTRRSCRE